MIRALVIQDYQECIALMNDIPEEFKRSLKAHERTPKLLDNLARELSAAERLVHLDRPTIKMAVYDFTRMFVKTLQAYADQKKSYEKNTALFSKLDANGNGTIEELGITIRDRDDNGTPNKV